MNKSLISLLAIILGIIIIALPMLGIISFQAIIEVIVILLGLFLLIFGISELHHNRNRSIVRIAIGVLILILGLILVFSPSTFAVLAALIIYLAGLIFIITGFLTLIGNKKTRFTIWSGVIRIVLGAIYIILGAYVKYPVILGALIGVWLLVIGILTLVDK